MRKRYSPKFKGKVAIEAIKGEKTIAEISSKSEVHRDQIQKWKNIAIDGVDSLFSRETGNRKQNNEKLIDELYKQIGQLKVENDWLKKKL